MSKTNKQRMGEIGEDVACKFLVKLGYKILNRNYWKKWGEIDIVASKNNALHFIEVKAVARPLTPKRSDGERAHSVSYETEYNPEDNAHPWKIKRLHRVIQSYLIEKRVSQETSWQLDIMAVFLDIQTRKAKVRITKNIIL